MNLLLSDEDLSLRGVTLRNAIVEDKQRGLIPFFVRHSFIVNQCDLVPQFSCSVHVYYRKSPRTLDSSQLHSGVRGATVPKPFRQQNFLCRRCRAALTDCFVFFLRFTNSLHVCICDNSGDVLYPNCTSYKGHSQPDCMNSNQ